MSYERDSHAKRRIGGQRKSVAVPVALHRAGPGAAPTCERHLSVTARDIDSYREALEAERWKLMTGLEDTEVIEVQMVADAIDGSILEHDRHVALDTRSRKAMLLTEVNEALGRIRTGRYGFCQECGEPISVGRLNALPWARLCRKCQEEEETGRSASGELYANGGLMDAN
jgi:DnaK suppressor protein